MAGAPQIGEDTKVTVDLKTIGMIIGFVITLAGMWFGLQADIAEAKTLPEPAIDRIEYDLKDELIRQTIMDTQEDVEEIKETIDKIDQSKPVIVEFYAKFNDANKFNEWDKLENVIYYRADIAFCPIAKKKYKIRMAPTLIIFKDGIKETVFKAGLDLTLPADLNDIQEAINEVNKASQF